MIETFAETGLDENILAGVEALGFVNPTEVQSLAIPTILESDRDLIALAQTGTGKTAAFGLPIIQKVDTKSKAVQAIILSPTRELAIQIVNDLKDFSKKVRGLHVTAVYGGANIGTQIRELKKGSQIVVGTPGRTLDLIRRKELALGKVEFLVLDEADEMLNMGFQKDLDAIFAETPKEKQSLLFSATMPKEIQRISRKYMNDPAEISVGQRNSGAKNVSHEFYMVHARERYRALMRILDMVPNVYGIVFCRTRRDTRDVARKLSQDGYNADAIYGDLTQAQRDQVMTAFRNKHIQILVATDVAARGIDVDELTHVINYELPDDLEVYVHRSGRTGRAGNSGISVSIIHTRETRKISSLERMIGKQFQKKLVPSGLEICQNRIFNFIDHVEKTEVKEEQLAEFLPEIEKKLEWMSREELIKHFISVEFNRFLNMYRNAPDLNVSSSRDRKSDRDSGSRKKVEFVRYHINVGSRQGLNPHRLMGLVNEKLRNRKVRIGKIEILRKFSFFEIDSQVDKNMAPAFEGAVFEGVELELSKAKMTSYAPKISREKEFGGKFGGKFAGKKKKHKRRQKKKRFDD
ncbi:MAG: DEAD/DEAH box helicase [Bacteroidia bacterium]|nr:DEAD/DEAH box helicase [Bacteroidia bacterium]